MSFRIPSSERNQVTEFVTAKPEVLDAIKQAIQECSPVLIQGDLISAIARKLRDVPGANRSVIGASLRTLIAMFGVLRENQGMSPSEAAEEVVETLTQKGDEYGTPPDGWEAFQQRIEIFLSDEKVLGLSAKAGSVTAQTERHVHGVRVLTDARPIFGFDAADGPKAFAIIHTLQIEYYENNKSLEWFVSLDGDDLENLQSAAERAIVKERSLRIAIKKLNVPVFSWKVDDDVS